MHKPKTISAKQLSDGALAVCVRCCDDEKTDSWHTLHVAGLSDEDVQQQIDEHSERVSQSHADMHRVHALVNKIIASK